jgi:PTH1 family peptidyl-tRNA hydrolase
MHLLERLRRKQIPERSEAEGEGPSAPTALIVGLGNPGREYARNRHNVGWQVADHFVSSRGWRFGKRQNDALIALGRIGDVRVVVAKPQTFMNLSGRAVQPLARFYKTPPDRMLVIYDDLDLPFGAIRLRERGGAGGHNGMKSIIERLGGGDFPRLRIGVGRPPGRMDAADYVLRDFDAGERAEMPMVLDQAARAIETFVAHGIVAAMNAHNRTAENASP